MGDQDRGESRNRPIFVVGTGRCGSTIVDSLLAMHPDLAWMPSWVDTAKGLPALALAGRIWKLPMLDPYRLSRRFPTPIEPYDTFRRYLPEFDREDVTPELLASARDRLVPLIEKVRRYHGGSRFLAKLVGRPVKVELFAALYPDAHFVHVTRELKPTLSSVMNVAFYEQWGPIEDWQWETIPQDCLDFYEECGRPEVIASAIRLRLNRIALREQLGKVPEPNRSEMPYGQFVQDGVAGVTRIADRCGLEVGPDLIERLKRRQVFGGADDKWRKFFDEEQVQHLDEFEARFGYE